MNQNIPHFKKGA